MCGMGPKRAQQGGCWVANVCLQALREVQGSEAGLNQGSDLPSPCTQSVFTEPCALWSPSPSLAVGMCLCGLNSV